MKATNSNKQQQQLQKLFPPASLSVPPTDNPSLEEEEEEKEAAPLPLPLLSFFSLVLVRSCCCSAASSLIIPYHLPLHLSREYKKQAKKGKWLF
jgi:hypothetical protein